MVLLSNFVPLNLLLLVSQSNYRTKQRSDTKSTFCHLRLKRKFIAILFDSLKHANVDQDLGAFSLRLQFLPFEFTLFSPKSFGFSFLKEITGNF